MAIWRKGNLALAIAFAIMAAVWMFDPRELAWLLAVLHGLLALAYFRFAFPEKD